jgi:uncharacterized membrane protein
METKTLTRKVAKKIFDYFLQGLLYIAPFGITIFIIYRILGFFDNLLQKSIYQVINFHIPGLGIVLLFLFISFTGFIGQRLISKPIMVIFKKWLSKAPLIETIYTSIRDFLSAFVGKEKRFTQPVLVKVNKIAELEKIGFLTSTDLSDLGIKDKVAVYFPHSYNFSGELFIVPSELITPLHISPAEAMKFIVSGGISKM